MSHTSPQTALQDYFDDLLGEMPAPEKVVPEKPAPVAHAASSSSPSPSTATTPVPESAPQRLARTHPVQSAADEELAVLEQSKREKLQALLNSKPITLAPAPTAAPKPAVTIHVPPPKPVAPTPVVEETVVEAPATEEIQPSPRLDTAAVDTATQEEAQAEEREVLSPFLAWHENGRPHWAQQPFEALLFDVSGLTLAVPLIALGQIHPLTDELTPIFGQADWFMGILPTTNGKVRTVNTARFVMPDRYDPSFTNTAKYVISLDGVPWGLAVDNIHQPKALNPDDVKWRTERGKRPWLAGTVKSAMCALLDVPQMGQMLMAADKAR